MSSGAARAWSPDAEPSDIVAPFVSSTLQESAIAQFMGAMRESSTAFLVRFSAACVPALRPTEILQGALESILLEPCEVSLISFNPETFAAVFTPRSQQPFDPLHVHSLLEMFRRALGAALGLPTEEVLSVERQALSSSDSTLNAQRSPLILPLAYVSPVNVLQQNLAELNEMLETILHKRLRVQFQAIVHLSGGCVYGYEALIRSPQGGVLQRPGQLFRVADNARLVSWLDLACQEKCFEEAVRAGVRDYLFINMDAEGLAYLDLADRSLADRAAECSIPPGRVVLEITERQAVEDFPRLVHYIEGLREQGFKVAIDDAGAGYNSLHAITEIRPDFVKIDRSLIRSIDNNGARRALLATLTHFAMQIGTGVIAEGIETRDELATVIEAGVPYAQGYLLNKPNDNFRGLRREMREFIGKQMVRRRERIAGRSYPIEKMARRGVVLPPDTPAEQIANKFAKNPDLESIIIVQDDRIEGLMMRDRFDVALAADAKAIKGPVSHLMDRQPLVVDAGTPVEDLARQAACRREMRFHDDILVARHGLYVGVVPVRALMEAITTLQVNRAKYANSLTMLPGPLLIEQTANQRLATGRPIVVVYADVNHFKAFNALYGIAHGDEVILATARLLECALAACGQPDDFLGHRGGDDFVMLLDPKSAEAVCQESIRQFDAQAAQFYSAEHRRQGFLEIKDSQGQTRRIPLFTLCLAGVSNQQQALRNFSQAVAALREPLRAAKTRQDSAYILGG